MVDSSDDALDLDAPLVSRKRTAVPSAGGNGIGGSRAKCASKRGRIAPRMSASASDGESGRPQLGKKARVDRSVERGETEMGARPAPRRRSADTGRPTNKSAAATGDGGSAGEALAKSGGTITPGIKSGGVKSRVAEASLPDSGIAESEVAESEMGDLEKARVGSTGGERAWFKEGQIKVCPPKGDPQRAFYESLLSERKESIIAIKYCIENGVLLGTQLKETLKVYYALKQNGYFRPAQYGGKKDVDMKALVKSMG